MSNPLSYLWRHPRRTGFVLFNLLVLGAVLAWPGILEGLTAGGVAAVPNVMLATTGMMLLVVCWVAAWLAWGYLVLSRRLRHHA